MFGLLKNKLSSFINNLSGRGEKKPDAPPAEAGKPKEEIEKAKPQPETEKPRHETEKPPQEKAKPHQTKPQPETAKPAQETAKPKPELAKPQHEILPLQPARTQQKEEERAKVPTPSPKPQEKKPLQPEIPRKETLRTEAKPPETAPKKIPHRETPLPVLPQPQAKKQDEPDLSRLEKKAAAEKRGMAPKIGIGASIRSFFSNEITIGEAEVSDLLEELELSLLEADVAYDVSVEVISQLRGELVGMKVPKSDVGARTKGAIQGVLESVMDSDRKFNFVERVKSLPRPAKILLVGPNGAGKTTTMAKLARKLMDSGLSVVFSASDTFRAAAIEQTEVHAGRLGIKVIKSKYGADPASVAFDAINYARANSVDVVLIDSAGRQSTNANLLSELVKINRIAKPDLKIYVGESIGGNSMIEQIRAFNGSIGMDGAILTKIDCDAKGGTAISVAKSTGIPILFLGVGQEYYDLVPFDAHKLAQEIMGGG